MIDVLSFAELNDCKILQDSFHRLLQLQILRPIMLHQTTRDRSGCVIRTLQKWLVMKFLFSYNMVLL